MCVLMYYNSHHSFICTGKLLIYNSHFPSLLLRIYDYLAISVVMTSSAITVYYHEALVKVYANYVLIYAHHTLPDSHIKHKCV